MQIRYKYRLSRPEIENKLVWCIRKTNQRNKKYQDYPLTFHETNAASDKGKKEGATFEVDGKKYKIFLLTEVSKNKKDSENKSVKSGKASFFYRNYANIKVFNVYENEYKRLEDYDWQGVNGPVLDKCSHPLYFLPADDSRMVEDSIAGTSTDSIEFDLEEIHISGPYDTTMQRLYDSTWGRHKIRTLVGSVFAVMFLTSVFFPAIASAFFAGWIHTTVLPFIVSKGFTLAAAKNAVALVGGFLAFTAPKWVGNIAQFVGKRILMGLVERVWGAIAYLPILLKRSLFGKNSLNFLDFILLSPAFICHGVGKYVLNKLGTIISGEELSESEIDDVTVDSHDDGVDNSYERKRYSAIPFSDRHPAIVAPDLRFKATVCYAKFIEFIQDNTDFPSLKDYNPKKSNLKPLKPPLYCWGHRLSMWWHGGDKLTENNEDNEAKTAPAKKKGR